jgi:hypothetical protein
VARKIEPGFWGGVTTRRHETGDLAEPADHEEAQ